MTLNGGTRYYIMIGGYRETEIGDLYFTMREETNLRPDNDSRTTPRIITALPYAASIDTTNALDAVDDPQPSCRSTVGGTVWFTHTPTADSLVRLTTIGSNFDTILSVWTGTPANLTEIACDDFSGGSSTSLVTVPMQAGVTYTIAATGDSNRRGSLWLTAADVSSERPINDDFDNALTLTDLPFNDGQNTRVTLPATDDPAPSCGTNVSGSVWYRYTPQADSLIALNILNSNFDVVLSGWTGTRGSLDESFCVDALTNRDYYVSVNSGQTIYLMAAGDFRAAGDLALRVADVSGDVADNDRIENARIVSQSRYFDEQDTSLAYSRTGEPTPACGSNVSHTIWYRFASAVAADVTISTQGSDFDTVLAVWRGSPGSLAPVGCDNDSGPDDTSILNFTAAAGETYYMMVGGALDNFGNADFALRADVAAPTAAPVLVAPAAGATTGTAPVFQWNAAANAITYQIEVADNPAFTNARRDVTDALSFSGFVLPDGDYHWRVRGGNLGGVSPWSVTGRFTVSTQSPADAVPMPNYYTTSTPVLTWAAVPGAFAYHIEVASSPTFASPTYVDDSIPADTLEAAVSLSNGTWYWRVRVRLVDRSNPSTGGNWGPWSETGSFMIVAP